MRKLDPKYWRLVGPLVWPIFLLIQLGSRIDFREVYKAEFWLKLTSYLFLAIALVGFIVGCGYCYFRFCRWFNRAIEAERSRVAERIALRNGEITWPVSHPLHDPELDR